MRCPLGFLIAGLLLGCGHGTSHATAPLTADGSCPQHAFGVYTLTTTPVTPTTCDLNETPLSRTLSVAFGVDLLDGGTGVALLHSEGSSFCSNTWQGCQVVLDCGGWFFDLSYVPREDSLKGETPNACYCALKADGGYAGHATACDIAGKR